MRRKFDIFSHFTKWRFAVTGRSFCVVVVSAIAFTAFVLAMRLLPSFMDARGWEFCRDGTCNLQDWLGATSGWFSGAVAAVAAYLLILQLRSQQRQTAFSVGDADPTMDAIQHLSDNSELVIRIVNWNRRGIVVRSIYADDPETLIFPNQLTVDSETKEIDKIAFPPTPIRGWENRSDAPHVAEFRVAAFRGEPLRQSQNWTEVSKVFASIQVLGDSHRLVELAADTRPIVGKII